MPLGPPDGFQEVNQAEKPCQAKSCRTRSLCDLKPLGVVNTGTLDEINVIHEKVILGCKFMIKDYQTKLSINKAVISTVTSLIFYGLILYLGQYVLPSQYSELIYNQYVIIGVILVCFLIGFNRYKELKDLFSHVNAISMIKKDFDFPVSEFKSMALTYKSNIEIQEKKLDILKIFSPVPVLIYGLGVYIEKKSRLHQLTS
ncbi:hypothetical protein D3C87_955380 [compost metagenome]